MADTPEDKKASLLDSINPFVKSDLGHGSEKQPSVTKTQRHHGVAWIDIENPTQQQINKLAVDYSFHPLHLEDGLLEGSLPQFEKEADYLFIVLHVPVFDKAVGKIHESQVAIFLGKDYLITIHKNGSPDLKALFASCEQDEQQQKTYFKRSAGYLLYSILKVLLDDASELVKTVLNELDDAEDRVFDGQESDANIIARLRQKILRLRRTVRSFRDTTADLAPHVHGMTGENLLHHYRDINREASWLLVMVEEGEKTIEIYKDADFTASTERTNQILAVLTIIFTLGIPATVIGTFYGMNIPLPGGNEAGSWIFLGQYTTLIVILIASVLPAIGMYAYFKNKHWI